jgi:hypothetical protein
MDKLWRRLRRLSVANGGGAGGQSDLAADELAKSRRQNDDDRDEPINERAADRSSLPAVIVGPTTKLAEKHEQPATTTINDDNDHDGQPTTGAEARWRPPTNGAPKDEAAELSQRPAAQPSPSGFYDCLTPMTRSRLNTLAQIGEDWLYLALLGIIMALLSLFMDSMITMFLGTRIWLSEEMSEQNLLLEYLAWCLVPVLLVTFSTGFVHLCSPTVSVPRRRMGAFALYCFCFVSPGLARTTATLD